MTPFDGHAAKYLGDGVMAFFGYPEAHNNDAERAVRQSERRPDIRDYCNEQGIQCKGGRFE